MVSIVGLGNPGKKFQKTRHNVGFRVIDELEKIEKKGSPRGEAGWILVKPRTFMNESGKAVKGPTKNLIVVHDDIDIPLGEFKIQKGKSSAGHKGVQSIIDELKTKDFWRVRIGICPKTGKPKNVEKFVLQNFTKEEEKILEKVIEEAIQEIEIINEKAES